MMNYSKILVFLCFLFATSCSLPKITKEEQNGIDEVLNVYGGKCNFSVINQIVNGVSL
jgi:hypothetical protein